MVKNILYVIFYISLGCFLCSWYNNNYVPGGSVKLCYSKDTLRNIKNITKTKTVLKELHILYTVNSLIWHVSFSVLNWRLFNLAFFSSFGNRGM